MDFAELGAGYNVPAFVDTPHDAVKRVGVEEGLPPKRLVGDGPAQAQKAEVKIPEEIKPTQEYRQKCFDEMTTTDDHGMHIFGIAKDQNGTTYYMVKNSWGESGKYKGIWYASENFVAGKSIDIVVHKDAVPKDIKKKLGIK